MEEVIRENLPVEKITLLIEIQKAFLRPPHLYFTGEILVSVS